MLLYRYQTISSPHDSGVDSDGACDEPDFDFYDSNGNNSNFPTGAGPCHDKFEVIYEHGSWTKHVNAGGCKNYGDTFWTNPQYTFTLRDPDDNCSEVRVAPSSHLTQLIWIFVHT